MKQISFISAKGGVGKTTLTAAFSTFASHPVLVDCDTELNDLRFLLHAENEDINYVPTISRVFIEEDECIRCGLCKAICHFNAIENDQGVYQVKEPHCQSCNLCLKACPVNAIGHRKEAKNQWSEAQTPFGNVVYGQLAPGEDLNGKLITIIRDRGIELAQELEVDTMLIDGPPAVGYAVASAIAGANLAVVVLEPVPSAIHDLYKAQQLALRYQVPIVCVINKCDLNTSMSQELDAYCQKNGIPIIGQIPFHQSFRDTKISNASFFERVNSTEIQELLQPIWDQIVKHS